MGSFGGMDGEAAMQGLKEVKAGKAEAELRVHGSREEP